MASHHQLQDQVCNTARYVWSSRDRLGYGATGAVFVGYNKSSGDRVAIKVFTGAADFKSLKREIDVVKSLPPHESIVKLFGVEEERTSQQNVIIMELCTGGSLYEVIDSPENAHGLSESEFKQVIYDVASGLQHLCKHNFIHRDIKPGNIMRCQKPDGSFVFKLADFGTARELAPGETFFSLHGTEEYLYPGMYERALVNPQKKKNFQAKVDLWSVGATFFHAATGRLPFQPFRKRDDRQLMFKIISEKEKGVISGWQVEPNGKIIYMKTLPRDTQISLGLKLQITPVLAGLLESQFESMMEFDDFFKCIEKIHRKKEVDVFCVHSCTCHKLYIDHDEPNAVPQLKQLIQQQTNLEPRFQELFHENLPYHPEGPITAAKLPVTTDDRPIFVFGGAVKKTADLESPVLPTLPSVPQGLALSNDVQFAKECAKVMWCFKFVTEQINCIFRLMHQAALCFGYTVHHEYTLLEQQLSSAGQLNEATCRVLISHVTGDFDQPRQKPRKRGQHKILSQLGYLLGNNVRTRRPHMRGSNRKQRSGTNGIESGGNHELRNLREMLAVVNRATDEKFVGELQMLDQEIRGKQEVHGKIKRAPATIRDKIDRIKLEALSIMDSWDQKHSAEIFHRSVETMQFMVRSVDGNYKTFVKERKHKTMSPHDQKVHDFTKIKLHQKLTEAQEKVAFLLTGRDQVYTKLGEWFVRIIPLRHDIKGIGQSLQTHSAECNAHLQDLKHWEEDLTQRQDRIHQRMSSVLADSLHGSLRQQIPTPLPPSQAQIPRQALTRLRESTTDLEIALDEQKKKLEGLRINGKTENQPQKRLVSRNAQ